LEALEGQLRFQISASFHLSFGEHSLETIAFLTDSNQIEILMPHTPTKMHAASCTFLERHYTRHYHSINYCVTVGMLGANRKDDNVDQGKKDDT
jgi:hypothetical protein